MSKISTGFGAAAVAVGLAMAGPQAAGIASADNGDTETSAATEGTDRGSTPRSSSSAHRGQAGGQRAARAGASRAVGGDVALPAASAPASSKSRTRLAAPAAARAVARPAAGVGLGTEVPPAVAPLTAPQAPASARAVPVKPSVPVADSPAAAAAVIAAVVAQPKAAAAAALPSKPPVLTELDTAVTKFFDSTASWLAGLPASPFHDVLAGGLLLVRRTLFNQLPTTKPFNYVIKSDGTVVGNVFASDAENDPLTYKLTKLPDHGTVQVGSDGSYTYTPGDGYNGYDSFSIAVEDRGFNLLDPFTSRSTDAFVEVPYWSKGGYTNNWTVRNFTASPVTLSAVSAEPGYSDAWDAHPPIGTVLQPGDEMGFELTWYAFLSYGAGPQFTSPNGNKWDVTFYTTSGGNPLWARSSCEVGDCRVFPNSSSLDYQGVLLLDPPGAVTINSETPGAADSFDRLIKLVGDNTGGGPNAMWDKRWTATYDNVTYTGGDSQWTSVLTVDNPTDNPQSAAGVEKTTTFTTTTTTTQQCGVPNCDYGFNVATAKYLIPLIVKLVRQDPSPTANNYGLSKATTETTTYTHKVTEGPIPWSANEVMLAPPTVDAVGDVTITYSDWCTTPSCTDSTNPPGDVAANQGPGGSRTYVFKDVAFKFPNYSTDQANFLMRTEPLQPKVNGVPTPNVGFKVRDPYSVFLSPEYNVGDKTQLVTEAYDGYGGQSADFTQRAKYTSSNPAVALVDSSGKLTALSPGTATITARYDWSIPLGGGKGTRSDYVWSTMDVIVK